MSSKRKYSGSEDMVDGKNTIRLGGLRRGPLHPLVRYALRRDTVQGGLIYKDWTRKIKNNPDIGNRGD